MKKILFILVFLVAPQFAFAVTCGTGSNVTFTDIGSGQCRAFLTSGSNFTVPSDWNSTNNAIEVIGGGGGAGSGVVIGGGGGGGGAYSKISNITLSPGISMSYSVGSGGAGGVGVNPNTNNGNTGSSGGDTYFNGGNCSGSSVCAKGGGGGGTTLYGYCIATASGGAGGPAASGVGTIKNSGGAGGSASSSNCSMTVGAGGGGTGGLSGSGGTGASTFDLNPGGAGGAGDGGSGGSGGAGGWDSVAGGTGTTGTEWDASHGSGGGGGGGGYYWYASPGGVGGAYGGGGGGGGGGIGTSGAGGIGIQGIIVITYAPPTCLVTADVNPLPYGNSTTLRWSSSNATSFYINSVGYVGASGSTAISPLAATNYNGTVTEAGVSATCPLIVQVGPHATLTQSVSSTAPGATFDVNWTSVNANSCTVQYQAPDGSLINPWPNNGQGTRLNNTWSASLSQSGSHHFWIDCSGTGNTHTDLYHTVTNPPPVCSITASPSSIARGQSSTLTWTSTNASLCTGDNFQTVGAPNNTSPGVSVSPQNSTTYTASCTGAGGTAQCASATVTVTCTPAYTCSGQTIQYTNSSCQTSNVTTCTTPSFCSTGSSVCLYPPPSFVRHLQAIPALVPKGAPTKLYWNVANVSGCSVSGTNGDSWSGASSGQGGKVSGAINQQTVYTMRCTGLDNSTVNESVTVNVVPVFLER